MANKNEDIETALFPEHNKLIIDKEGCASAFIVDIELDPIRCVFNNDNCVELDTKEYSYLSLSIENLEQLIKLTKKAQRHYDRH